MVDSKKYSSAVLALYLALLPIPPCGQPHYHRNITATATWTTASASSLPDGAILFTTTRIMPYFSNLAAIGLAKTGNPEYYPRVKDWMQWYLRHLNYPDKWGLHCTMYDYNVSGATEAQTRTVKIFFRPVVCAYLKYHRGRVVTESTISRLIR